MSDTTSIKKILFLAANPKNTSSLRLDEEVREIESRLRLSSNRDNFSLTQKWAVRSRDLRSALLEVKPQIIHFSGHGTSSGGIILENSSGEAHMVPSEALAEIFELFSDKIECVILNACYSESQAVAIAEHINYVVGMNNSIGDNAAIEFAVGFYDALGGGESFEKAFKFGCNAIHLENIPEHLTPVLKTKDRTKILSSDYTNPNVKVSLAITFNIDLNQISEQRAEELVEVIKRFTNNYSITLEAITEGSTILLLNGSNAGLNKIKQLFEQKKLREVEGLNIQEVKLFERQQIAHGTDSPPSYYENLYERLFIWLDYVGISYEHFMAGLKRSLRKYTTNEIDDLVMETIDRGLLKLKQSKFLPSRHPLIYFSGFARYVGLESSRKARRYNYTDLAEVLDLPDSSLETNLETEELMKCLEKCLKNALIDEDRRMLLEYYDSKEKKVMEHRRLLADSLGLNIGTLRKRITRVKYKLRKCIEECMKLKEGD